MTPNSAWKSTAATKKETLPDDSWPALDIHLTKPTSQKPVIAKPSNQWQKLPVDITFNTKQPRKQSQKPKQHRQHKKKHEKPRKDAQIRTWIQNQVEFYFSLENLLRDVFLRSKMDDQGYLDLDIIVGFNRMQQLISYAYSVTHPEDAKDSASNEGSLDTVHPQMDAQWMRSYVHSCLSQSQTLESKVDGQQVMVRLSQGWEQWIIRNQVIPQLAKKIVTPPTSPPGQKDWEKSVLASPKPSSEATFASEEDLLDDALETLTLFSRLSLAETLECKNVHMCKMGKQLPEEEGVIGYLYDKESIDGYVEQSYQDFRTQALGDQSSQLMLSLYHFWSLFLQDRFVRNMYADFQQCALEEAVQGKREGLDLLYKFYLERLRKEWSQDLFLDFQQAALQDHEERQHNSGLVQVSQLLKNLKQKPALLPQLHELMEKALDSENIYS